MEWSNAQKITFSVDLFAAAKQQLRFLSAVDSAGCLHDGHALDRAIYRYKNCWLPLLAKHMVAPVLEGPLVVPFDCEWIWHCHRLNPLQYKRDCEEIYGKILGTSNVMSTVDKPCTKQSESIWNNIYVTEPYNLDLANVDLPAVSANDDPKLNEKNINYDLVAAVERQSSFFSKVSKDMKGIDVDQYLKAAVARYKAFLHMTKTVKESNPEINGVPTRDIDLIWHTHQLNPLSYCQDLMASVGAILDHNDRDIGTSEGKKMAGVWFTRTQQLWEESFGNKYLVGSAAAKKQNMVLEDAPGCACAGSCSYNCVATKQNMVLEDAADCACAGSCIYNCVAIVGRNGCMEDNGQAQGCYCTGSCSYNCLAVVGTNPVCSKPVADNLGGVRCMMSTVAAAT